MVTTNCAHRGENKIALDDSIAQLAIGQSPTQAEDADLSLARDTLLTSMVKEISQYLDCESTVRLSQTCCGLYELLTRDPHGAHHRIKVPYFSMLQDMSITRNANRGRIQVIQGKKPQPQPVFTLATHLLPKIDFSSLKYLELRCPLGERVPMNGDEEMKGMFIHLAVGLQEAAQLEVLHIDFAMFMKYEELYATQLYSETIFEMFAKNLAKCTLLRRLKIFNCATISYRNDSYSSDFLLALMPSIERRATTLEEVTIILGSIPTRSGHEHGHAIAREFFVAVLRLQCLKELHVQIDGRFTSPLNEFLAACEDVYNTSGGILSESTIERFDLCCILYKYTEDTHPLDPRSVAPCLGLFGNSPNLQRFMINALPGCWDRNSMSQLNRLLSNKPMLSNLCLLFNGYDCPAGKSVECICDFLMTRESHSNNSIYICGLGSDDPDFDDEETLGRYHTKEGNPCLDHDDDGRIKFRAKGHLIRW